VLTPLLKVVLPKKLGVFVDGIADLKEEWVTRLHV
jgi:hypothetical protein